MIRKLVLLTCLLPVLAVPAAAKDEGVKVRISPLKGDLYLLQGRGGNVVASVGAEGVLLVDDDYAEYSTAYRDALATLEDNDQSTSFVLNTHWHGDHTGGNRFWGERGAVIVAHDNVRGRMSTRQEMKRLDRVVEPSPPAALPVVTFADALALHFNGEAIEVQHYPAGHTDGDSVVFFSGHNVVHMGDLFFNGAFPFVDLGSGGNVLGYAAGVESALARMDDDTLIVPGHGPVASKGDLESYLNMLKTTAALVRQRLASGMSVEAIVEQGLGEEWAQFGKGFINEQSWIGFIADSL